MRPVARSLAIASAVLALASILAGSAGAKKPYVFPNRWVGTVTLDFTGVQTDVQSTRLVESATLTFARIPKYEPPSYKVKSGTMTWNASGDDAYGCHWTSSGSRAMQKDDGFLQLTRSAPPYKAYFAAPDELKIPATNVCGTETNEIDELIDHPLFPLSRKVAGVAVTQKRRLIKGSSTHSSADASGSESSTYTWSFKAAKP